jgi:hypothetical protein
MQMMLVSIVMKRRSSSFSSRKGRKQDLEGEKDEEERSR